MQKFMILFMILLYINIILIFISVCCDKSVYGERTNWFQSGGNAQHRRSQKSTNPQLMDGEPFLTDAPLDFSSLFDIPSSYNFDDVSGSYQAGQEVGYGPVISPDFSVAYLQTVGTLYAISLTNMSLLWKLEYITPPVIYHSSFAEVPAIGSDGSIYLVYQTYQGTYTAIMDFNVMDASSCYCEAYYSGYCEVTYCQPSVREIASWTALKVNPADGSIINTVDVSSYVQSNVGLYNNPYLILTGRLSVSIDEYDNIFLTANTYFNNVIVSLDSDLTFRWVHGFINYWDDDCVNHVVGCCYEYDCGVFFAGWATTSTYLGYQPFGLYYVPSQDFFNVGTSGVYTSIGITPDNNIIISGSRAVNFNNYDTTGNQQMPLLILNATDGTPCCGFPLSFPTTLVQLNSDPVILDDNSFIIAGVGIAFYVEFDHSTSTYNSPIQIYSGGYQNFNPTVAPFSNGSNSNIDWYASPTTGKSIYNNLETTLGGAQYDLPCSSTSSILNNDASTSLTAAALPLMNDGSNPSPILFCHGAAKSSAVYSIDGNSGQTLWQLNLHSPSAIDIPGIMSEIVVNNDNTLLFVRGRIFFKANIVTFTTFTPDSLSIFESTVITLTGFDDVTNAALFNYLNASSNSSGINSINTLSPTCLFEYGFDLPNIIVSANYSRDPITGKYSFLCQTPSTGDTQGSLYVIVSISLWGNGYTYPLDGTILNYFVPPPSITSVVPSILSAFYPTSLTVTGSGFLLGDGTIFAAHLQSDMSIQLPCTAQYSISYAIFVCVIPALPEYFGQAGNITFHLLASIDAGRHWSTPSSSNMIAFTLFDSASAGVGGIVTPLNSLFPGITNIASHFAAFPVPISTTGRFSPVQSYNVGGNFPGIGSSFPGWGSSLLPCSFFDDVGDMMIYGDGGSLYLVEAESQVVISSIWVDVNFVLPIVIRSLQSNDGGNNQDFENSFPPGTVLAYFSTLLQGPDTYTFQCYAVNRVNGFQQIWSYYLGTSYLSRAPAGIPPNSNIIVVGTSLKVFGFDAFNGSLVWEFTLPVAASTQYSLITTASNGVVYFSTESIYDSSVGMWHPSYVPSSTAADPMSKYGTVSPILKDMYAGLNLNGEQRFSPNVLSLHPSCSGSYLDLVCGGSGCDGGYTPFSNGVCLSEVMCLAGTNELHVGSGGYFYLGNDIGHDSNGCYGGKFPDVVCCDTRGGYLDAVNQSVYSNASYLSRVSQSTLRTGETLVLYGFFNFQFTRKNVEGKSEQFNFATSGQTFNRSSVNVFIGNVDCIVDVSRSNSSAIVCTVPIGRGIPEVIRITGDFFESMVPENPNVTVTVLDGNPSSPIPAVFTANITSLVVDWSNSTISITGSNFLQPIVGANSTQTTYVAVCPSTDSTGSKCDVISEVDFLQHNNNLIVFENYGFIADLAPPGQFFTVSVVQYGDVSHPFITFSESATYFPEYDIDYVDAAPSGSANVLFALDSRNGSIIFTYNRATWLSPPAVYEDDSSGMRIVVVMERLQGSNGEAGRLVALNGDNGDILWYNVTTNGNLYAGNLMPPSISVSNGGIVYIGGTYLSAFSVQDGTFLWQQQFQDAMDENNRNQFITVFEHSIFYITQISSQSLYYLNSVDAVNGSVIWKSQLAFNLWYSPVLLSDGNIFLSGLSAGGQPFFSILYQQPLSSFVPNEMQLLWVVEPPPIYENNGEIISPNPVCRLFGPNSDTYSLTFYQTTGLLVAGPTYNPKSTNSYTQSFPIETSAGTGDIIFTSFYFKGLYGHTYQITLNMPTVSDLYPVQTTMYIAMCETINNYTYTSSDYKTCICRVGSGWNYLTNGMCAPKPIHLSITQPLSNPFNSENPMTIKAVVVDLNDNPLTYGGLAQLLMTPVGDSDGSDIVSSAIFPILNGVVAFQGISFVGELKYNTTYEFVIVANVTFGSLADSTTSLQINFTSTSLDCPQIHQFSFVNTSSYKSCICAAGTERNAFDQCQQCLVDFYNDEEGGTCVTCPKQSTSAIGSVSLNNCLCSTGYFMDIAANAYNCVPCAKSGMACYAPGAISDSNGNPPILPGFYASNVSSSRKSKEDKIQVYPCPNSIACLGGYMNGSNCAVGYEGPLCGSCDENYFLLNGNFCYLCPSTSISQFVVAMSIIVTLGFILLLIKTSQATNDSSIISKIILNHLQILTYFSSFQSNWSQLISSAFQAPSLCSSTPSPYSVMVMRCLMGQSPSIYYDGLLFMMLLPLIMIALVTICCAIGYFYDYIAAGYGHGMSKEDMKKIWLFRYNLSLLVVIFFIHPSITKSMADTFGCKDVGSELYLITDMSVRCDVPLHQRWQIGAGIYLGFYCFGIPLAIFGYLQRTDFRNQLTNNGLNSSDTVRHFAFLISGYKPEYAGWEMLIMLRKLLIVIISVFLNPALQIFCGIWFIFGSLELNSVLKPRVMDVYTWFENLSLWTLIATLLFGLLLAFDSTINSASSDAISIVLIIINILCLSALVFKYLQVTHKRLQMQRKTKSQKMTASALDYGIGNGNGHNTELSAL